MKNYNNNRPFREIIPVNKIVVKEDKIALEFTDSEALQTAVSESLKGESAWLPCNILGSDKGEAISEDNFLFIAPSRGRGTPGSYTALDGRLAINFSSEFDKNNFVNYCRIGKEDILISRQGQECSLYLTNLKYRPIDVCYSRAKLVMCINSDLIDEARLLIDKLKPEELEKQGNESLIISAARQQMTEVVRLLIEKNPKVINEVEAESGKNAFQIAISTLNLSMATMLLDFNPAVAQATEGGTTVLNHFIGGNIVSAKKNSFIKELLSNHREIISFKDEEGNTLMHAAATEGMGDILKTLLSLDPDKSIGIAQDSEGYTPLMRFVSVCYNNSPQEVCLLVGLLLTWSPESAYIKNFNESTFLHCFDGRWIATYAPYLLEKHPTVVKELVTLKNKGGENVSQLFLHGIVSRAPEMTSKFLDLVPLAINDNWVIKDNYFPTEKPETVGLVISKMTINPFCNPFYFSEREGWKPLKKSLSIIESYFNKAIVEDPGNFNAHFIKAKIKAFIIEYSFNKAIGVAPEKYNEYFTEAKIRAFAVGNSSLIKMNIDSFKEYCLNRVKDVSTTAAENDYVEDITLKALAELFTKQNPIHINVIEGPEADLQPFAIEEFSMEPIGDSYQ